VRNYLLLAAFLFALEAYADTKHYSETHIISTATAEKFSSAGPMKFRASYQFNIDHQQFVATCFRSGSRQQPKELLLLWHGTNNGYELAHKIQSGVGEIFQKPMAFALRNSNFIYIATEPTGSGGFVLDFIFWLAPDGSVHPVRFQHASEIYEGLAESDEIVMNGGKDEFIFEDGAVKFKFWLGHEGDPNCCPSAGVVTGNYKLTGDPKYNFFKQAYTSNFELTIDQMQREGISLQATVR
jgi:hypothetical protein